MSSFFARLGMCNFELVAHNKLVQELVSAVDIRTKVDRIRRVFSAHDKLMVLIEFGRMAIYICRELFDKDGEFRFDDGKVVLDALRHIGVASGAIVGVDGLARDVGITARQYQARSEVGFRVIMRKTRCIAHHAGVIFAQGAVDRAEELHDDTMRLVRMAEITGDSECDGQFF